MERPTKNFSEEELRRFPLPKIKDIAESYGLVKSRNKGVLIEKILAIQGNRGLYLKGQGKYQQDYNSFIKKFFEVENPVANFFNVANQVYVDYFQFGMRFGESFSSEISELPTEYFQFIYANRPYSSESMERFMDAIISKIKEDLSYFNNRKEVLLNQIRAVKNPRYVEIVIPYSKIQELSELSSLSQINSFLQQNNLETVHPGDIIGARISGSRQVLPNLIGYLEPSSFPPDTEASFDRVFISPSTEEKFKNMGKYPLPDSLRLIGKEELENIYHFTFLKLIKNKLT